MYNTSQQHTAILFFSKTSRAEAERKKLAVAKRQTKAIAQVFINNTRQILRGLDLPVFTISEQLQRGDSFGERLHNAFQDIFDKGFTNVIAVGNDCLTLTKNHIQQAIDALETDPSVLGPSTDGGVYLLGFQKEHFNTYGLKNIAWQTNNVFNELAQNTHNQCVTLDILSDIDTANDLIKAIKDISTNIKTLLIALLRDKVLTLYTTYLNWTPQYLLSSKSLRAPPYSVA